MDTEKIKHFPSAPGVYLMKDKDNNIIYIGKASSIKKRIFSYFQTSHNISARKNKLVSKVKEIDYIVTSSKAEALLFEASLIKEYQPQYNVALKDDKSYPLLKLTVFDNFPRLYLTRQRKNDGAKYFGPYADVKLLRVALKTLRDVFPLRTCRIFPKSVCLNYHIGQCLGPCVEKIDKKSYQEIVREVILLLEGKRRQLLKELFGRMVRASNNQQFEKAARIRDRLGALSSVIPSSRKTYRHKKELSELKTLLKLSKVPQRIEAFDISNTGTSHAVGSMVLFYNGESDKSGYRRFRIKDVKGINDYAMLEEIIIRRYTRDKLPLPDLVLIDGGRGHLFSALHALKRIGLKDLAVISIAKVKEEIFLPQKRERLFLPENSSALQMVRKIRDEAHRFAISYHKALRAKTLSASGLDNIKNIGPKRKADLIKHFRCLEDVKGAKLDQLLKVKGISRKIAKDIIVYFNAIGPKRGPGKD